jgi:flagellar biosynthesis/type III secretory pathway protein FliH
MEKDDKIFEDMMQTALARLRKEGKIVIRMSPEEYRNFSSPNAQFVINNERIQAAIVEEPLFGKGDLIVESEGETINAGVDSQLRYIELAFRGQGNIA